jgi:hypothetical protein
MSTEPSGERVTPEDQRFDSWKEIAAYLGRSEKTVRRWEEKEGLVVHRLVHEKRGSVYGYRSELDAWRASRKETAGMEEVELGVPVQEDDMTPAGLLSPSPVEPASTWRQADIGAARPDIDEALASPEQSRADQWKKRRSISLWIVVGAGALLIAAGAAVWQEGRTPVQEIWSGVMLGGPPKAFQPRLSPDGQLLAFLAFVDRLPQLFVMKRDGGSWAVLTSDRDHGSITTAAWSSDGSKIYFDRTWGYPLGIYSVPPLGGEPRMVLDEAFGPEPLPDGSLIVVKMTDRGDNQLFHFWPESGKLEPLPAFLQNWSDIAPMLRAFPDGKELVYFGTTERDRSQSARMLVFDLASRQSRELAPGLPIHPRADGWSPLSAAPGGVSAYVFSKEGDTDLLVEVPRKSGRRPKALLSFPESARPVGIDAGRDGSLYLDLFRDQFVLLRVGESGGAGEEFGLPTNDFLTMVSPDGDVLLMLTGWGQQRVAAVHPGREPRVLVETSEETTLPATTFGGNVALVIGSGDQRRIAMASLRDGRVMRRFSMRSDNGMAASPDGQTLYYAFGGAIWAQPVAGGRPGRITEGIDVTIDPKGEYLYVKRVGKGLMRIVRIPVAGGYAQELPVPAEYHLANPGLSPAAVDARGRILVSVISKHSFYYETAILDPASKSFTLVPITIEGDAAMAGWAPDGRILVRGHRYLFSLWRYQRSNGPH